MYSSKQRGEGVLKQIRENIPIHNRT
jgi:hypothetical protein